MCAVTFWLFLPRCAAREQDLRQKWHPIYYGEGNQEKFNAAAAAFDEVVRVCSRAFAAPCGS
jgi:hypothetical protein